MPTKKVIVRKKKGDSRSAHWSPNQKYEAVVQYLATGSIAQTSRITGVPVDTINKWKTSEWWTKATEEVKKEANTELQSKLGKIITKSIDVLQDRLDNGDFVYNPKTGKVGRVGVKAQVANQIAGQMIDKQVLLEKLQKSQQTTQATIEAHLKNLHDEFLKFSKAKDVTNVEDVKEAILIEASPTTGQSEGEGRTSAGSDGSLTVVQGELVPEPSESGSVQSEGN